MSEFQFFPKLPREIQEMIWSAALHEPRTVTIRPSWNVKRISFTTSQPPVLLRVNSDSRCASLRYYGRYFKDRTGQKETLPELKGCIDTAQSDGIFLNMDWDVVEILCEHARLLRNHSDFHSQIRHKDIKHLDIIVADSNYCRNLWNKADFLQLKRARMALETNALQEMFSVHSLRTARLFVKPQDECSRLVLDWNRGRLPHTMDSVSLRNRYPLRLGLRSANTPQDHDRVQRIAITNKAKVYNKKDEALQARKGHPIAIVAWLHYSMLEYVHFPSSSASWDT